VSGAILMKHSSAFRKRWRSPLLMKKKILIEGLIIEGIALSCERLKPSDESWLSKMRLKEKLLFFNQEVETLAGR
jgi:hypothetical protein